MNSLETSSCLPTSTQQKNTDPCTSISSFFHTIRKEDFCSICQVTDEGDFSVLPCGHSFHHMWFVLY